jgi:hypothetical protein
MSGSRHGQGRLGHASRCQAAHFVITLSAEMDVERHVARLPDRKGHTAHGVPFTRDHDVVVPPHQRPADESRASAVERPVELGQVDAGVPRSSREEQ